MTDPTPHSGRVVYEGWFSASNAAYARFGRALVECGIRLRDSYRLSVEREPATVCVMVDMPPATHARFVEASRVRELRYRSPTIFDNGSLVPRFASPEDEIAGRETEACRRIRERQDRDAFVRAPGGRTP